MAGRATQCIGLLEGLDEPQLDDISRGRSLMVRANAQAFSGATGAMAAIPAICVAAAVAFEVSAPQAARDALLTAFERSTSAEWMMTGTTLTEIARPQPAVASGRQREPAEPRPHGTRHSRHRTHPGGGAEDPASCCGAGREGRTGSRCSSFRVARCSPDDRRVG